MHLAWRTSFRIQCIHVSLTWRYAALGVVCNHGSARNPSRTQAMSKRTVVPPYVNADDLDTKPRRTKKKKTLVSVLDSRFARSLWLGAQQKERPEPRRQAAQKENRYPPRRLNRLVNVLPQPGTGHLKMASFRRLLALAACVAVVVTCCFSTWRMGGSRTAPLPIASAGAIGGLDDWAPDAEEPASFLISAARKPPGEGEGEGRDQECESG